MNYDVNDAHRAGALVDPQFEEVDLGAEDRPDVLLVGDMEDRAQILLGRLAAAHRASAGPRLYVRGRELVRVAGTPPVIEMMTPARLRAALLEAYRLFAPGDGEGPPRPYTPPEPLLGQILERAEWPDLPPLERIIRVPGLGPGGVWLTDSGYVPELAAGVDFGDLVLPDVPRNPSSTTIRPAVDLLLTEMLGDFAFASQADRANALALLLAPLVRYAIDGCMPFFLISTSTPGMGKTLLGDALSIVSTGIPPTSTTERHGDDETRKAIGSLLAQSPAVIRLDNLTRRLSSPSLASVLTARRWTGRLLGRNDVLIDLANDAIWTATANNLRLSSEMRRRTVLIRLEAPCEHGGSPVTSCRSLCCEAATLELGRGRPPGGRLTPARRYVFEHWPQRPELVFDPEGRGKPYRLALEPREPPEGAVAEIHKPEPAASLAPVLSSVAEAKIRAIETEALAEGWTHGELWTKRFWNIAPDGHNRPGLASLTRILRDHNITAVSPDAITLRSPHGSALRFRRWAATTPERAEQ